jgi:pyruvate ferredoxin oxidoreductase alpha subunit
MKKFLEGSGAVAEAVRLCKPGVISAYPITPQTRIVERLADFVANGQLESQFINVESEHSAASVVLGAEACGVRAFTATSSQGLILMSEVLFNIAGLRLPLVLVCANRALSAPINIWNDHQDAMALRDSGWIQFYAENNQEVLDFIFQAYKLGEDPNIMLPVMINMDGYILTHGMEPVDVPEPHQVDKFLPPYNPPFKLDVDNVLSLGLLGDPTVYLETRFAIQKTLEDTLELIPKIGEEFKSTFGRKGIDLIEEYKIDDADNVIIAMGSVCGTIKDFVDKKRDEGQSLGLIRVLTYRPFPKGKMSQLLKDKKQVLCLEKAISLGSDGPLYTEIKSLFATPLPKISGFIAGLGGRDITFRTLDKMLEVANKKEASCYFLDVDYSLLKEKFYVSG